MSSDQIQPIAAASPEITPVSESGGEEVASTPGAAALTAPESRQSVIAMQNSGNEVADGILADTRFSLIVDDGVSSVPMAARPAVADNDVHNLLGIERRDGAPMTAGIPDSMLSIYDEVIRKKDFQNRRA